LSSLPSAPSISLVPDSDALKLHINAADDVNTSWITAKDRIKSTEEDNGAGLSEREIYVLKLSSKLNGRVYMPWLPGEEQRECFRYDHVYSDPDGVLQLSPNQLAAGAEWRRPAEFITEGKPVMVESVDALSIKQHLVSDCSFVCSLCIAASFESKFKKRLITSIIYPQNSKNIPVYNAYGKYLVKLTINGVKRKVVIDDKLPYITSRNQLACSYSAYPNELWVSIIEKAYMKVNGGYDFPGSNSDVDLFALTGWIPEHVYFQEEGSESSSEQDFTQSGERAWQRIQSAHKFGDCLVRTLMCTDSILTVVCHIILYVYM
jgi:calpain-7